jgi:hypothetical protein
MSGAGALNVAPPFGKPTHARTDARRVAAKLQVAPSIELGNGLDNLPQDSLLPGIFSIPRCLIGAGARRLYHRKNAASGLAAWR